MVSIDTPRRFLKSPDTGVRPQTSASSARLLTPQQRLDLALGTLRREGSVTGLAAEAGVSRKFVYAQKGRAMEGLTEAFSPEALPEDFVCWIPITKPWLRRATLSAAIHCHGSERGIAQHLKAIVSPDLPISGPTVHNILHEAAATAKALNEKQGLGMIREGAHDEIFSQGVPVLVGVEPRSTFVYLMQPAKSRGEVEWWAALTEKHERQGLDLTTSISDAARGLRAGVQEAFPGIDLRGDVLHAQMELSELGSYLENRAYGRMNQQEQEERRMERAKTRQKGQGRSKRLALARTRAGQAVELHDELALLVRWITELLQRIGPDLPTRKELYDWLVAEMEARAHLSHRIGPVVTYLKNQRDDLLAFAGALGRDLDRVATNLDVPRSLVEAVYQQFALDPEDPRFDAIERRLSDEAPDRAVVIEEAVLNVLDATLRASSAVENINSLLRPYFFLRRSVGPEFLQLLEFHLNHRRFARSRNPERVGKSPCELLTGEPHGDWLEMLGYPPCALVN